MRRADFGSKNDISAYRHSNEIEAQEEYVQEACLQENSAVHIHFLGSFANDQPK
jgi:hypothetical protein